MSFAFRLAILEEKIQKRKWRMFSKKNKPKKEKVSNLLLVLILSYFITENVVAAFHVVAACLYLEYLCYL